MFIQFFSAFTRISNEESKIDKKHSIELLFSLQIARVLYDLDKWPYNFISIDGKLRKKCAAKHKLAMGNTS